MAKKKVAENKPQVTFAMVQGGANLYDSERKIIKSLEDGTPVVLLERVAEYGIKEDGKMQTASKIEVDGVAGYVITTRLTFGINP